MSKKSAVIERITASGFAVPVVGLMSVDAGGRSGTFSLVLSSASVYDGPPQARRPVAKGKRGPGRPPKAAAAAPVVPIKRGPGRPPKNAAAAPVAPVAPVKRGPGRPPKVQAEAQ